MVAAVEDHYGRIDLLVSNAGFASQELDLDDALAQPDATWQQMWSVHVLAHLRACRAALPSMLARGSGQLVSVASAAGLQVSRIDGSPLRYNQPDPWLPDLLICRPDLAMPVLHALRP